MGGSASTTRTLEIENPNVITLSDKVVERLRGQEQSVPVDHGSLSLPAFVQPSSLQIQRVVQQELDENDKRWEQRFRHINDSQNAQNRKVEIEYKRTYESVKKLLPQIGDGALSKIVKENENNLLDCLAKNNGAPLNCTDTIKDYQRVLFQSTNQQI
ncbi:Hypothetical protein CINCED_3A018065 [Cinara cedri]|uniref:Uncharacterized protein n=1 Tax=Cinara cedri TaxID=506608 RepID=A0A5E4M361_9HEMI|nr:Hypothetical protein CINCED_3A018065 [Cinara cedri]